MTSCVIWICLNNNLHSLRSRLKRYTLLHRDTEMSSFLNCQKEFREFFSKENDLVLYNDAFFVTEAVGHQHDPTEWRLFIQSSKFSLKVAFLHNRNKYPSVPLANAANVKESYENMKQFL